MAIFRGDIRSSTLAMDTQLYVVLPYDRPAEHQQTPCKTLYLLHGLGENASAWTRYSAVERYARDRGIALVMPEVQRSFYLDMELGLKYFTYVADELPALCRRMFHLSGKREDTFVAGLSMGGYGALKCALTYPDRYAGCASFSGVADLHDVLVEHRNENNIDQSRGAFGMDLRVKLHDNLALLANSVAALPVEEQPRILMTCGKQDFLYPFNANLRDHLRALSLPFHYEEWDGVHEWGFWDRSIQLALNEFLGEAPA